MCLCVGLKLRRISKCRSGCVCVLDYKYEESLSVGVGVFVCWSKTEKNL